MFLAAIGMQESGCDANNVGGAGEQGIMQITSDKCPGGQSGSAWFVESSTGYSWRCFCTLMLLFSPLSLAATLYVVSF